MGDSSSSSMVPTAAAATATFKLLLMGDSGVGKSSILLRFVEDRFLGEDVHAATIGVDFKVKMLNMEGTKVKLTVWDTAGQERFRTLTSSYYRGAHGVVLVYDVCSRESFKSLRDVWMKELETYAQPAEMILMVIANKIDKENLRQVSKEEGIEYAKELSALYMECSAKAKVGITAAFEELVHTIMHSPRLAAARSNAGQVGIRNLQVPPPQEGEESSIRGCSC